MALGFLRGSPAPRDAPNAYVKSTPSIGLTHKQKKQEWRMCCDWEIGWPPLKDALFEHDLSQLGAWTWLVCTYIDFSFPPPPLHWARLRALGLTWLDFYSMVTGWPIFDMLLRMVVARAQALIAHHHGTISHMSGTKKCRCCRTTLGWNPGLSHASKLSGSYVGKFGSHRGPTTFAIANAEWIDHISS